MAKSDSLSFQKNIPVILGLVLLVGNPPITPEQTLPGMQSDVRTDLASALRVVRPLVRDDPQRAIQMLKKLSEEYPTNSHVLVLLGESYRVVGDAVSARKSYEDCLRFHPAHLQAGASLGLLHIQGENVAEAEAVFQGLLERTGYGINTYRTIASTLSRFGYFDLALGYYERGRQRNNGNSGAHGHGRCLVGRGSDWAGCRSGNGLRPRNVVTGSGNPDDVFARVLACLVRFGFSAVTRLAACP